MSIRPWLCAAAVASLTGVASADILSFTSVSDNTLLEDSTGSLSNALGGGVFAGVTNSGEKRRALVRFDLSTIPAGSTITSVTLRMNCEQSSGVAAPFSVHRVTASWGEGTSNGGLSGGGAASTTGDATWIHRFFNTENWTTPGGDFISTASASINIQDLGFYEWTGAGLVADAQAWVNDPEMNFGLLIKSNEVASRTGKRFGSRETSIPDRIPKLIVEFTPVPAPGALALLAGGGLVIARRRRR